MNEVVTQPLLLNKKSRSSRFSSWSGNGNSFRDKISRSIYIFLLFAMDFIMFIYSINGRLIENGKVNQAVLVILGAIFAVSLTLILLLSFSKIAQNVLCALVTMLVTIMFFYQFGMGDVDNFLEVWLNKHARWLSFLCICPSPWIIGFILGLLVFFAFLYSDAILFVMLIFLFSAAIGVHKNESLAPAKTEYQEVKKLPPNVGLGRDSNIVYLMAPKLPSYQFLNSIRDVNFRELRDLIIGFYVVNGFEVYPNAFVQKNDSMSNIIDILNQVNYNSTTSANRGYAEFLNDWNFIHGGIDYISLEENQLYDYLRNSGFGVSMYAMPGFDFCLKGGDFYTDRCVVKGYKNVSVYDEKATLEQNVNALLGEWILSLKSRDFRSFARSFINTSPLKNMKVLSENRRVSIEGAASIFERLSGDFKRDKNGQVYLTYVDLPSDIYIYDEYCNIKPRKEWVALKDNSLYTGSLDDKRKAYVDQAKCLIGKMQEYMEDIYKSGKADRTDIFVQGISPIRELAGVVGDKYNRFVSENLVNLGIRKGKKPKFLINANVCLASDFTKTLIRYQDYCYSVDNMKNYSPEEALNLKKNLVNNSVIRGSKISNIAANYRDWYDLYRANSTSYQKRQQQLKAEQEARLKREAQGRQKKEGVSAGNAEGADVSKQKKLYEENIFEPTDDFVTDESEDESAVDVKEISLPVAVMPADTSAEKEKTAPVNAEENSESAKKNSVETQKVKPQETVAQNVEQQEQKAASQVPEVKISEPEAQEEVTDKTEGITVNEVPAAVEKIVEPEVKEVPVIEEQNNAEPAVAEVPAVEEEKVVTEPEVKEVPVIEEQNNAEPAVAEVPAVEEEKVVTEPEVKEVPIIEEQNNAEPAVEEQKVMSEPVVEEVSVVEEQKVVTEPEVADVSVTEEQKTAEPVVTDEKTEEAGELELF